MRADRLGKSLAAVTLLEYAALTLTKAQDCAPYPIPINIGNVSLSNQKTAWGIGLTVGTPEQSFAFMPQWTLNNTFVYGTDGHCDMPNSGEWSAASCVTFRGGAYDSLSSTTRVAAVPDAHPVDDSPYPEMDFVADSLKLNDNTTLLDFPMGIAQSYWEEQGYTAMMAIGLGANSTILNVLKSTGKIASRTWSLFYGLKASQSSSRLNGSFVLGGYDKAKVAGNKHTQSLTTDSDSCKTQMVVTLRDMTLNFANGTDVSLMGKSASSALSVCINPTVPVFLSMPLQPYFNNWMRYTGNSIFDMARTKGLNFWNLRYPAGVDPYDGDLTITFDSGLAIRMPNDLLVVPDAYIDQQTGDTVANTTGPDLLINSLQDVTSNEMAVLGSSFLEVAYLMCNLDSGQFSLWSAFPTLAEDIVAVDTAHSDVTDFCASAVKDVNSGGSSSSAPAGSSTASGTTALDDQDAGTNHISTGGIAGIAVGAVAVGVIAGWLVIRCVRRKKNVELSELEAHSVEVQEWKSPVVTQTSTPSGHELQDTSHLYRHELTGTQKAAQYEMPG